MLKPVNAMQFKLMQCRECKVCKDSCSSPNVTMHFIILCIVCDRRVPWQVETKLSSHPVYNTLQCLVVVLLCVLHCKCIHCIFCIHFFAIGCFEKRECSTRVTIASNCRRRFFCCRIKPKKKIVRFFIHMTFVHIL